MADVERNIALLFGELGRSLGLPRSYGLIYGIAFASATPVTFDDVVKSLHMSKGSASQGMRWLKERGFLVRMKPEGRNGKSRVCARFAPVTELAFLLRSVIRDRVRLPLQRGAGRLTKMQKSVEAIERQCDGQSAARALHLRQCLSELDSWYEKSGETAPLLLRLTS